MLCEFPHKPGDEKLCVREPISRDGSYKFLGLSSRTRLQWRRAGFCAVEDALSIVLTVSLHTDTDVSWHLAGENWTAAKKASDKKDSERLPPGFSPPRSALSAVNGMLRRLMTLGELNLYNYSGGMPALAGSPERKGSPEMNGNSGPKVNGTALGKAEKVNGVPLKVAGLGRNLVQVGLTLQDLDWWG